MNSADLLEKDLSGILLILNTPGSLEHFMVHTDPKTIQKVFDNLLEFTSRSLEKGCIEFGFKLGKEDKLSFYVNQPYSRILSQENFEEEFESEAELISEITDMLKPLGGKIWIAKSREAGRTFWFTMDVKPPEQIAEEEEKEPISMPYPDWSEKTILIVDDVHTNLILLETFLNPTSAKVISVDNGLKAVNAVKRNNEIDFVLMDVRMPVLDGYEATRRIKRNKPWLPVIAISAYPGSAESEKWKLAGCDAYLGKPLNFSELLSTMESFLEKVPSRI